MSMTKADFAELARQLKMCKPEQRDETDREYRQMLIVWKECVYAVNTANRFRYKGGMGYDSGKFVRACGLDDSH